MHWWSYHKRLKARFFLSVRQYDCLLVWYSGCLAVTVCNSLCWLSYPRRVAHKLCLLTYKCLQGWAPVYFFRLCVLTASVSDWSWLRSADDHRLPIAGMQTVTHRPRAFSTSGSAAWNTVLPDVSYLSVTWLFQTFTEDVLVSSWACGSLPKAPL